jgi:hypothetical protein
MMFTAIFKKGNEKSFRGLANIADSCRGSLVFPLKLFSFPFLKIYIIFLQRLVHFSFVPGPWYNAKTNEPLHQYFAGCHGMIL